MFTAISDKNHMVLAGSADRCILSSDIEQGVSTLDSIQTDKYQTKTRHIPFTACLYV